MNLRILILHQLKKNYLLVWTKVKDVILYLYNFDETSMKFLLSIYQIILVFFQKKLYLLQEKK